MSVDTISSPLNLDNGNVVKCVLDILFHFLHVLRLRAGPVDQLCSSLEILIFIIGNLFNCWIMRVHRPWKVIKSSQCSIGSSAHGYVLFSDSFLQWGGLLPGTCGSCVVIT